VTPTAPLALWEAARAAGNAAKGMRNRLSVSGETFMPPVFGKELPAVSSVLLRRFIAICC